MVGPSSCLFKHHSTAAPLGTHGSAGEAGTVTSTDYDEAAARPIGGGPVAPGVAPAPQPPRSKLGTMFGRVDALNSGTARDTGVVVGSIGWRNRSRNRHRRRRRFSSPLGCGGFGCQGRPRPPPPGMTAPKAQLATPSAKLRVVKAASSLATTTRHRHRAQGRLGPRANAAGGARKICSVCELGGPQPHRIGRDKPPSCTMTCPPAEEPRLRPLRPETAFGGWRRRRPLSWKICQTTSIKG